MSLNWNEIKSRAIKFSKDWKDVISEKAEAKTFWDEFFKVFGVSRVRVASFEKPVKMPDESTGYIDLLWKGTLLVEHKSKGKNLDKAFSQAKDYFPGIDEKDLPKYILVSDFERFRLYDLEADKKTEFNLRDLHKRVHLFDFILGFKRQVFKEEDPVNIEAANLMGLLHDQLKLNGYEGHNLERFLVRILFIMFADDTGIINPKGHFEFYIRNRTAVDGSDLGGQLSMIFQILNTQPDRKPKNLDEDLNKFPYINGDLFSEPLPLTTFDADMRRILLECCHFDWSSISPAIFGSLFQSVMDKEKRRDLGAHYTSEKNIMKVIKGLFLDDLYREFAECKDNPNKLEKFHNKISKLKFLDPACGCGNFLIIAYRELRLLEIEILRNLQQYQRLGVLEDGSTIETEEYDVQMRMVAQELSKIDVDCMYGIEIEEFPSRIAEVAMWLMDHQMNLKLSEEFGEYNPRIPLKKSPHIVNANALKMDWKELLRPEECNYILGNPPFVGKQLQSEEQKSEMLQVLANIKGNGILDYVTAWYIKASHYIQRTNIKVAFVSTNSIVQGEQVGILWNELYNKYKIKIHFAHKTFKWDNEAKGKASVYVVIIGFGYYESDKKYIYDYETIKSDPVQIEARNINSYLIDSADIVILPKSNPICDVPEIYKGNQPTDGGFLILSDEEKKEICYNNKGIEKFIKPLISGKEYLNNEKRWCFWLVDIEPVEIRSYPLILERINKVKEFREKSTFKDTRELAATPYKFRDIKNPETFIVIPATSSENRKYIPFGFFDKNSIPSNSVYIIPNASIYHFGVLISSMQMIWVKYICGRLKSDYRYSKDIVYNNFPWPENPLAKNIKLVEQYANLVLDTRNEFPNSSLADLYDPLTMPPKLVDAHNKLDKAVDLCYRPQPFPNELSRLEYLFELYKKFNEPLFEKNTRKKKL